jgi:hypothetical protein
VVLGIMLVACGGQSETPSKGEARAAPIHAISGSRLTVRHWQNGAVSMPSVIYDEELDIECAFELASDGVERCLPTKAGFVQFGDDECRQPIAFAPQWCDGTESRFARLAEEAQLCKGVPHSVYRLEEPVTRPSEIFQGGTGTCEVATETGLEYFAATLVEPKTFARGDRIVIPRTSELGTELVISADGLVLPVGVYDLSRKRECRLMPLEDDGPFEFRCLSGLASSDAFANDCAGGLAVSWLPLACGRPEVVAEARFAECRSTPTYELFELGSNEPKTSISPVFGGCEPNEGLDTFPAYEVGPSRSAEGYAAVSLDPVGEGRLRHLHFTSGETLLLGNALWDASFEARCGPRTSANGRTYCVPENLPREDDSERYADAACTVPLHVHALDGCEPEPPLLVYRTGEADGACRVTFGSYHRLEPFDDEYLYRAESDGTCSIEERATNKAYSLVGDEVLAEDAFVELTLE